MDIGIAKETESNHYIFPSEQGFGYGSFMKNEFLEYLFKYSLLQMVVEKVKVFNERNNRIIQKLGFKLFESDLKNNYYEVRLETLKAQLLKKTAVVIASDYHAELYLLSMCVRQPWIHCFTKASKQGH